MKDWTVERIEINRTARTVLVRHRVDLGLVTVRVYPRKLNLRGLLVRLPGSGDPLDAITVGSIVNELERIQGVRKVHHELDNWRYCTESGEWKKVATEVGVSASASGGG